MDFDGGQKKGFVNWKYEEKDMKRIRTITAIFTPVVALCYLFSVNVINMDEMKKAPQFQLAKAELHLVEDTSNTWYNQLAKVELKSKALAKR